MIDMTAPYDHLVSELDDTKFKGEQARKEITRLTAIAETYEEVHRSPNHTIQKQIEADADRNPGPD